MRVAQRNVQVQTECPLANALQPGRHIGQPACRAGLRLDLAQDIQCFVDRTGDLAAHVHNAMAVAGIPGLDHDLARVEIADFAVAGYQHLGAVDRHIHFRLPNRLPAGEKPINAAAHVPTQLELSGLVAEGKIMNGTVVNQVALRDLAAQEGTLHPRQRGRRQAMDGKITRRVRAVTVVEIHAQLYMRRYCLVQREAHAQFPGSLDILAGQSQIVAVDQPVIGVFLPFEIAADAPRRQWGAKYLRERHRDVIGIEPQISGKTRQRQMSAQALRARIFSVGTQRCRADIGFQ